MQDRELLMDSLEKDAKAKKEEYERQKKALETIYKTEEEKANNTLLSREYFTKRIAQGIDR
jgi:hypothetical protein